MGTRSVERIQLAIAGVDVDTLRQAQQGFAQRLGGGVISLVQLSVQLQAQAECVEVEQGTRSGARTPWQRLVDRISDLLGPGLDRPVLGCGQREGISGDPFSSPRARRPRTVRGVTPRMVAASETVRYMLVLR